jgi:hypothetical protein
MHCYRPLIGLQRMTQCPDRVRESQILYRPRLETTEIDLLHDLLVACHSDSH